MKLELILAYKRNKFKHNTGAKSLKYEIKYCELQCINPIETRGDFARVISAV